MKKTCNIQNFQAIPQIFRGVLLLYFFSIMFSFTCKAEFTEIKGKDKEYFEKKNKILNKLKKGEIKQQPFQVVYIVAQNFCVRCCKSEIEAGWQNTPLELKKNINIQFWTDDTNIKSLLKIPDSTSKVIQLNFKDKVHKNLLNYAGKAIIFDNINKKLFCYKTSSKAFGNAYRYVDSVMYYQDLNKNNIADIKPYFSKLLDIPDYVNNFDIEYEPELNRFCFYSKKEGQYWIYDTLLNLKKIINLYSKKEIDNQHTDTIRLLHNNFVLLNDSNGISSSLRLSNSIDTISFNRKSKHWNKVEQLINFYHIDSCNTVLDSSQNIENKQVGTFLRGLYSDKVWGVFYLRNADTIFHKYDLFTINQNHITNYEAPLEIYAGNQQFVCAFKDELHLIYEEGFLYNIKPDIKYDKITLSYYEKSFRKFTNYDGSVFSIQFNQDNKSYVTCYNDLGLRILPPIVAAYDSYCFVVDNGSKIINIYKSNEDKVWKLEYYNFKDFNK